MKRILIFSTAYFPLVGGAEVAVKEITDRLPEFTFVMLTARLDAKLPAHERIGNVEVHRIGRGNQWDKFRLIGSGSKPARHLGKFDLVWAIMASYAGFAAQRYKKKNPSVPFLLTLQEGDSRWQIYKHVWWCWPYFKQIFKQADHIQAISTFLARWGRKSGGRSPATVVPNGVDLKVFTPALPPAQALVTALGWSFTDKIVVTVSRLVAKNGTADLIAALTHLPAEVKLLIIGSGELESQLKKQVSDLSLDGRVVFLGHQSQAEVARYLQISHVFCRPSLSEGLGNSFLEAMSAGLPVVATPVGGIPDFLLDGVTGLYCRPRNPKDIAAKIKIILADPALATRLRTAGRRLVEQRYSWETVTGQMRTILVNLINRA